MLLSTIQRNSAHDCSSFEDRDDYAGLQDATENRSVVNRAKVERLFPDTHCSRGSLEYHTAERNNHFHRDSPSLKLKSLRKSESRSLLRRLRRREAATIVDHLARPVASKPLAVHEVAFFPTMTNCSAGGVACSAYVLRTPMQNHAVMLHISGRIV